MSAPEQVVLLDESGRATGVADKATVHHAATPLHLAFSCYVLDDRGRLLVTRRALDKATFPGVWTNSCCGHPAPGERLADAVRRRVREELGLDLTDLRLVLPAYRYEATMDNGVRENEMCPVLVATATGEADPDRTEVAEARWEPWTAFRDAVLAGDRDVSVWCAQQVAALAAVETADGRFPEAPPEDLPPAAR